MAVATPPIGNRHSLRHQPNGVLAQDSNAASVSFLRQRVGEFEHRWHVRANGCGPSPDGLRRSIVRRIIGRAAPAYDLGTANRHTRGRYRLIVDPSQVDHTTVHARSPTVVPSTWVGPELTNTRIGRRLAGTELADNGSRSSRTKPAARANSCVLRIDLPDVPAQL